MHKLKVVLVELSEGIPIDCTENHAQSPVNMQMR